MNDMNETAGSFLNMVVAIVVTVLDLVMYTAIWEWYLVPLGLPTMSMKRMFGCITLLEMLMYNYKKDDYTWYEALKTTLKTFGMKVGLFIMAWIVYAFF